MYIDMQTVIVRSVSSSYLDHDHRDQPDMSGTVARTVVSVDAVAVSDSVNLSRDRCPVVAWSVNQFAAASCRS